MTALRIERTAPTTVVLRSLTVDELAVALYASGRPVAGSMSYELLAELAADGLARVGLSVVREMGAKAYGPRSRFEPMIRQRPEHADWLREEWLKVRAKAGFTDAIRHQACESAALPLAVRL